MRIGINLGKETPFKILHNEKNSVEVLTAKLRTYFNAVPSHRQIIFVCVGTDRSTGDSLGPLVGSYLLKNHLFESHVFGTIDYPVHAMNLVETLQEIHCNFREPFIVGVDACLGQLTSVGCIQIGSGPVKPGAGVNKELPPVGDIHVTGIVNVGGFMEYFVLQNTRLSLVMNMAEVISQSFVHSMVNCNRFNVSGASF